MLGDVPPVELQKVPVYPIRCFLLSAKHAVQQTLCLGWQRGQRRAMLGVVRKTMRGCPNGEQCDSPGVQNTPVLC